MVGESEPVNLPSTVDEYPNWRRKLSLPLEGLPGMELFDAICAALRDATSGAASCGSLSSLPSLAWRWGLERYSLR